MSSIIELRKLSAMGKQPPVFDMPKLSSAKYIYKKQYRSVHYICCRMSLKENMFVIKLLMVDRGNGDRNVVDLTHTLSVHAGVP